jgi:hypothetical protein
MDMVHEDREPAREETLLALDLVIEYLLATLITGDRGLLNRLSKLREALFELGAGIVDPVLRPNMPNHRVPDSFHTRAQKMMAAAGCDLLIQLNES